MKTRKLMETKPIEVFKYFEDLTFIPRESSNESGVADYLVDFAETNNLEWIRDKHNNVIIKKDASKGYEDHKGIIIQSHTDMVCKKKDGYEIDFMNDSIEFNVQDDMIIAENTTLGADDGIGVAFGLAIMADKNIKHPAIELVCTSEEELGFFGAEALDMSVLKGKRIINIDHGCDNEFCIGCAGGPGIECEFPVNREKADMKKVNMKVSLNGLIGGHSGEDIDKGRGHAVKLFGRFLEALDKEVGIDISTLSIGTQDSAIPRSAEAVICIDSLKETEVKEIAEKYQRYFSDEYYFTDPNITINCEIADIVNDTVIDKMSKQRIFDFITFSDSGVVRMDTEFPEYVESSVSTGVVKLNENNVIMQILTRSSRKSIYDEMVRKIIRLTEIIGGTYKITSDCPEWEYKKDSVLADIFQKAYKDMFNSEPKMIILHAGLEPGVFIKKMGGDIEAIAYGPNIKDMHTPGESLQISSVEKMWEFTKKVLALL